MPSFLQGLCAQTFYGHMHSINHTAFNLRVSWLSRRFVCNLAATSWLERMFDNLSPVYTAQTDPGSPQLCSHGKKPKTRVNTNLGRTRVNFSYADQQVAFTGEVIVFCNQVYCFVNCRWRCVKHDHKTHECACAKSKLTRVRPRFVFTRHFSSLTRCPRDFAPRNLAPPSGAKSLGISAPPGPNP